MIRVMLYYTLAFEYDPFSVRKEKMFA